jgi:hypothetical protein
MRPGGGKAKGSAFEREISRYLTLWASGQTKDLWYWRSPSSGALLKTSNQICMAADIVGLTPEGQVLTDLFSIELKKGYPETNFFQYFKKGKFNIESFWKQCCNDAWKAHKQPMLIYKKPPTIIGVGNFLEVQIPHMTLEFEDLEPLKLYELKEFFSVVTYDNIKKIWENMQ